ncbi:unnamed protein product [Caenorhabditis bovis]|uniref:Uncharacterized protein n=1 Tax=Caenorhabditis bovis TaxID=2654633 RepID=A0A8S1E9I8_9PELO|nr:unnamed protein product [Caenorhabditis bovis]
MGRILLAFCLIIVWSSIDASLLGYKRKDPMFDWSKMQGKSGKEVLDAFKLFKTKFKKSYKSAEEETFRMNIFIENHNKIVKLNEEARRNNESVVYGVNKFNDWTDDEFRSLFRKGPSTFDHEFPRYDPISHKLVNSTRSKRQVRLPPRVDLREVKINGNYILPEVKDQGHCGCCWAFAAVAVAETANALVNGGKMTYLSDQEVCDCANGYSPGCFGGHAFEGLKFAYTRGLTSEYRYPYDDGRANYTGMCRRIKPVMKLRRYFSFTPRHPTKTLFEIKDSLNYVQTPIAVSFEIGDKFRYYKEGYLVHEDCKDMDEPLYHSANIVGYFSDWERGRLYDFYILRNSWGYRWGDGGYVYVAAGRNWCGIEDEPLSGEMRPASYYRNNY